MTFPKESIWQELRISCLDAIPVGSHVSIANPSNLASWQTNGFYKVVGTTTKRFNLVASAHDFGSALLTDAEHLLDNAAEHQVSLWNYINSNEWLSPAWTGVTFYYWAYFLGLALTRLTGRTAWFLTKETAKRFKQSAPASASAPPGAGCFRLSCGAMASATDRELMLEKRDSRVHDELWQLWLSDCADKARRLSSGSSTSLEERLFAALSRSAQKLGTDWPSATRNAINYRPGFAYTAVRRERVLESFAYLKTPRTYDLAQILERFEKNVLVARGPETISAAPQVALGLLVDLAFVLHGLVSELHVELIDRHKIDRRWRMRRHAFLRRHGLIGDDGQWPI